MKYVVTGGAGFIGSALVDKLIEDGHEVIVFDNLCTGKIQNLNPKAQLVTLDITNDNYPIMAEATLAGADTVFHLAALARVQPSIDNPLPSSKTNIEGTLKVLCAANNAGVRRFVYSASSSAYGDSPMPESGYNEECATNPLSPYGLQKLVGEQYCKLFPHVYGIETVCLRYFNVFGERQNLSGAYALVMGIFAQQRLDDKPMTIYGDGEQRRDFTYVGDVVRANILAANSKNVGQGEVINIGNGDNRSVNQIADLIGGPKEYLEERLEPRETLANNRKAKEILGWEPTTTVEEWIPPYIKGLGL